MISYVLRLIDKEDSRIEYYESRTSDAAEALTVLLELLYVYC